jgi:glycosyltransferase involved in cell wall biosynthesis
MTAPLSQTSAGAKRSTLLGHRILAVVPGEIDRLTGGSIYDKRVIKDLAARGAVLELLSIPDLPYLAALFLAPMVTILLLFKIIRSSHDLVVEDGWAHPALWLFNAICRVRRRPALIVIVHQVRWLERPRVKRLARLIERISLQSANLLITVSDFMRREIELLIGQARVEVCRPGSDQPASACHKASPDDRGEVRLLFVGNCARRKGLHTLIEAVGILKGRPIKLDVVGATGAERGYLRRLRRRVDELGLVDVVTFRGAATGEALAGYYAAADLFVMPSLYEGYGIVYAEAMRAGLPVIATKVGPVFEIVRDGENALLVDPGDASGLAAAIDQMVTDRERRVRFSRRSLELAVKLPSWEATCERIARNLLSVSSTTLKPADGRNRDGAGTSHRSPVSNQVSNLE